METDSCLHMGNESQQRTIVCINSKSLGPSVLFQTTVRISSNSVLQILALYLDLKVQRTSMFFKSSFGALEDAGGS